MLYYYHKYKINAKHALSVQLQPVGEQAGDRVKYLLTDDFIALLCYCLYTWQVIEIK